MVPYRWIQNSVDGIQPTLLAVFVPVEGIRERNVIISIAERINESLNGAIQLVESNTDSWRFHVVHDQCERHSNDADSDVFFGDLMLEHLEVNQEDISGRYFFENVNSGYVADVNGFSTEDGANLL